MAFEGVLVLLVRGRGVSVVSIRVRDRVSCVYACSE